MKNNPQMIYQKTYFKPVRKMREYNLVVEAYLDRSVKRYHEDTILPKTEDLVDGVALLNVYGQWIYNSLVNTENNNLNNNTNDLENENLD